MTKVIFGSKFVSTGSICSCFFTNNQLTMEVSDDDYSTDGSLIEVETNVNAVQTTEGEYRRVSPRFSGQKRKCDQQSTPKRQNTSYVIPTDIADVVSKKEAIINKIKGTIIDSNLSMRIIRYVLKLQEDYLRTRLKCSKHKRRSVHNPHIRVIVCDAFGISNDTYNRIISSYFKEESNVFTSERTGNRTAKTTRIPRTERFNLKVRNFVREKRYNRELVTGRSVTDFLIDGRMLHIKRDDSGLPDKTDYDSAYKAVRRSLLSAGYRRGKRSGGIIQKESIVLLRNEYLRAFFANRALPPELRLREVMLDESYIHHHYNKNQFSLFDPADKLDVREGKDPAKGKRYCFIAAIQGPNPMNEKTPDIADEERIASERAGLVHNSVWSFVPTSDTNKKVHEGDYHKVFNADNFLQWWKDQLLPNLTHPSLIILDNASYHKVLGPHVPKPHLMKKQELQKYLLDKGEDANKPIDNLRADVRDWIKRNEKPQIERLANAAGHKVLFTPPYHSDLQPIELVWAHIKGNVGKQYNRQTTFKTVGEKLNKEFIEFEKSGHCSVGKMIESCARTARRFYDSILNDEVGECEEEDEEGEEEEYEEENNEYVT